MDTHDGRRREIETWYRSFQDRFCQEVESLDGAGSFRSEVWERTGGGGGDTRQLVDGELIDRASVNFSAVWGQTPPALTERLASKSPDFYATGVSIIVHPSNPHAPTFHANIRYFAAGQEWFGGGADLTPSYLYEDDARHFHETLQDVCSRHQVADYPTWKQDCDDYFHLPHRGEARGVGGIFFDHLDDPLDEVWRFQVDLGEHLAAAYLPILEARSSQPFDDSEKRWQELRRGRYVEFNLVWDRGTKFGLETGGRTASILGSLPPKARWEEPVVVEEGSPEEELLNFLSGPPRSWVTPV